MIKRFLYIEDGSVDVDSLRDELGEDTMIIVYRQGAAPPIIAEPIEPAWGLFDSLNNNLLNENEVLKKRIKELEKYESIVKESMQAKAGD